MDTREELNRKTSDILKNTARMLLPLQDVTDDLRAKWHVSKAIFHLKRASRFLGGKVDEDNSTQGS